MVAYKPKRKNRTRGNIYVTDKKVCFYESWSDYVYMDLPLEDILGFKVKKVLFITFVEIHSKDKEVFSFSGFPTKNLQNWLKEVNVKLI